MALRKNSEPFIDPLMLFNQIRLGVTDTLPLLGSLKDTGHQEGASFLLFLKDKPVKEWGYLTVKVNTAGKLFINDEYRTAIDDGGIIKYSLNPGEYKVNVVYPEGEHEIKTVKLEAGNTSELVFEWKKPKSKAADDIDKQTITENKQSSKAQRYLSSGVGFGVTIPVSEAALKMDFGYGPQTVLYYNFVNSWGTLSLGLMTGCIREATKTTIANGYTLYAVPVAAALKYTTGFDSPLFGFLELAGGASLNLADYQQESIADMMNVKPFIMPALGIGYRFIPQFALAVYGNYLAMFFEDYIYMNIIPGLRLEINF